MRWLALLLQIVIAGAIGFYLAMALVMGMSSTPARNEVPPIIILGGAVIGLLAWLFGLIADRTSLIRLVLTVALSILGLTVSYLLIEAATWTPPFGPEIFQGVLLCAAFAAPIAGAMAGYFTPSCKPSVKGQ